MPRAIPIRRPTPEADRPNPRGLALLAVICFGVGLALSAKTLTRTTDAGTHEPIEARTPSVPAAPSAPQPITHGPATPPPAQAPTPAAPTGAPSPTPAAPAVGPVPTRVPDVAPSIAPSGVHIERGRIAYIRCEGVPPRAGPVPCPRDPGMERIVWTAIDGLAARCPALANARGTADVRVVFDGRRFSGLGFHPATPPALAEATRACLEPQLNGLTQSLGATRLTASFRFDAK